MKIAFVIDHSPLMNLKKGANPDELDNQGLTFFQ